MTTAEVILLASIKVAWWVAPAVLAGLVWVGLRGDA